MTYDEMMADRALLRIIATGTYKLDNGPDFVRILALVRRKLVSVYTDDATDSVRCRLKQAGKTLLATEPPTGHMR